MAKEKNTDRKALAWNQDQTSRDSHYGPYRAAVTKATAERLVRKRVEAGLTQSELGDRLGFTLYTVSRYETGERTPSIERLTELAMALGCSVRDLIPEEDEWRPYVTGGSSDRLKRDIAFHETRVKELKALKGT